MANLSVSTPMGLSIGCRACALQKSDIQIKERWANKLLPGEDWDVDDDEDYIHAHDIINVFTVTDSDNPNIKWTKLQANQSTLSPVSRKMFIDCMKAHDVSDVNLNLCAIDKIDSTMWALMKNINRLNLSGCCLDSVPHQIRSLRNLRTLDLSYNDLQSLPNWIGELPLETLDVFSNKLSCLPDKLGNLSNLTKLNISTNQITSLPESLGNLTNLKCIEGACNELTTLPDCFGSLKCIVQVNFHHNHIRELPPSFSDLNLLNFLDLSFNDLTKLPETINFASTISNIVLDDNCLTELPDWFVCLPKLQYFSCKSNHLKGEALSKDFLEASKQLKQLNFNGNKIDTLPDTIASINTLTHLEMGSVEMEEQSPDIKSGNKLKVLPRLFGVLSSDLVELRLDQNNLAVLPDGFGSGLCNLVKINLFKNALTKIPSSFCLMKNLQECVLSRNGLTILPDNFGDLVKLTQLRLDHNEVNHLPLSFSKCTELSTLDLAGNRFSAFPTILAKLPKLDCLGFDIHLSNIPIVIEGNLSTEAVLNLHRAILRGLEFWNRKPTSIKKISNISNEDFIETLIHQSSSRKRKCMSPPKYGNRAAKHARSHFDFFEIETMIFDDEDEWKNGEPSSSLRQNLIKVTNAEQVRTKIQREIAFTERLHMPRMPNKPVAVPLFNRNPLKVNGPPLAYKSLAPLRRRRFIIKKKKVQD